MALATEFQNTETVIGRTTAFLKELFSRADETTSAERKERAEAREREFRKHFAKTCSNARVWL